MIKKQIKMFKRDIDVTYSTQCHMYIHIYIYIHGSKNIDRNRPTGIGLIKTRPGKLYICLYIYLVNVYSYIYNNNKNCGKWWDM